MSFSLEPHPIGVKYWTNIWKESKDVPFAEAHSKFQSWYQNKFYKSFGRFYYRHRAGSLGALAPLVVGGLAFKFVSSYYGILRDNAAAIEAGKAYGQGGYKSNPVPK
ncbi:unnamed protein product [Amoebophrya sp. A25]|nr:unnamed protein product [Amoebophrya sp. A25]|eukprot:GSA25T00019349001.1